MNRRSIFAAIQDDWLLIVAAAVAYAIQCAAWPIDLGRDGSTFLLHYFDLFRPDSVLPLIATYRTPLPALWFGATLEYFGPVALEFVQGISFVAATWMAFDAARHWGHRLAVLFSALMLMHTWYAGLYHRINSDGMFAFVFMAWLWFAIRTAAQQRIMPWVVNGALVFLLVMARPAAQLFAVFGALPLMLVDRPPRLRIAQAGAAILTTVLLVGGWSGYNYVRFGFFGVSRLTYAAQPFFRVFVADRLIRADNGPASRELATAVEQDLLPHEPYRSAGISLDEFMSTGTFRTWSDVVVLSDRRWGWDSRYRTLRDAAIEAIRANPGAYALGVLQTFVHAGIISVSPMQPTARGHELGAGSPVDVVPRSYADWILSTPDGRYHPESPNAAAFREFAELNEAAATLDDGLPPRDGSAAASRVLNRIGLVLAPMLLVMVAGAIGLPFLCLTTDARERVLCTSWGLSLLYLAATFAGQTPAIIQYRLPFDPAFMLTAIVAVSAIRRGRSQLRAPHAKVDRTKIDSGQTVSA